jgi:bifunctional DNase/RNase
VIELDVVGITARPKSDEQKRHQREEAQGRAEQPEASVRLKERTGARALEFMIGPAEAQAIALALQGRVMPRPMTHDLIGNVLRALDDVSVVRLVITKRERELPAELARQLAEGEAVLLGGTETFYAELELRHGERVINLDCRPSDGIAVAIRLGVPIVAADDLGPCLTAA